LTINETEAHKASTRGSHTSSQREMPAPFSSSEQPSACPPYKEATLLLGLGALLLGMGVLLLMLVLLVVLLLVLQISLTPAARPLAMLFTSTSKASNPG
jgi:hypothetical protein